MQHCDTAAAPSDVCGVCSKQFSKYRCPRCFIAYCGVVCYKSHNSSGCAEAFYRECAVDHLKSTRADGVEGSAASAAEEMTEILRRVHMQDAMESGMSDEHGESSEDDEDAKGLAQLIQRIDEGEDIAIDDLPENIRESFISSMKTGAISNLVTQWTPWWDKHDVTKLKARADGTSLITLGEDADGDPGDEGTDELPPLPHQPLPPLCSLVASSTLLSDSLKYHTVSIIYSYCFAKYVYNGDWSNDALETSLCTVQVSGVLEFAGYGHNSDRSQGTHTPSSTRQAIMDCTDLTTAHPAMSMNASQPRQQFLSRLVRDTLRIYSGRRGAILRALSDLDALYTAAIREVGAQRRRQRGTGEHKQESASRGRAAAETSAEDENWSSLRKVLKKLEKKAYFMLVWVNDSSNEDNLEELFYDLQLLVQEEVETSKATTATTTTTVALENEQDHPLLSI